MADNFYAAYHGNTGGGGGGGTPGGSDTQVQYNSSGSFAGSSNFTWDNTNQRLQIGPTSTVGLNSPGRGQVYLVNPTDANTYGYVSESNNSSVNVGGIFRGRRSKGAPSLGAAGLVASDIIAQLSGEGYYERLSCIVWCI